MQIGERELASSQKARGSQSVLEDIEAGLDRRQRIRHDLLVQIYDRYGNRVPNPIFSKPAPSDRSVNVRDKGMVFLAGIVGVPWQDIARQKNGKPDLSEGLKDANELEAKDPITGLSAWDVILGDPAKYVPPKDPLMIESVKPRDDKYPGAKNPITNDPIVPPGGKPHNAINGAERTITTEGGDLQYACMLFLALSPRASPAFRCDSGKPISHAERFGGEA